MILGLLKQNQKIIFFCIFLSTILMIFYGGYDLTKSHRYLQAVKLKPKEVKYSYNASSVAVKLSTTRP